MNSSSLSPFPSSRPTFLFHPFTNLTSLRLTRIAPSNSLTRRKYQHNRLQYRVSTVQCSIDQSATTYAASAIVFGGRKELSAIESLTDSLSPRVRLSSSVVVLAGALAAGYWLWLRFVGERIGGGIGVLVFGAIAGCAACVVYAVYAVNSCTSKVAAVNLHNFVASCDDPLALKKEDIEAIANKYGVSIQNKKFNAELCDLYCRFVSSVIPAGGENLKGDEVKRIITFKNTLGIDDPESAAMHMKVGRRLSRQMLEAGGRDAGMEQRLTFQKLIYVSSLIFGEASTFLLPWKRVFKVTDSQVEIAIRDNAQRLYASKLKPVGRDVDVKQLMSLREDQLLYGLSDELAEDMFREHTRKLVEEHISNALNILKSKNRSLYDLSNRLKNQRRRGTSQVVEEIEKILAFNHLLISLRNHPDISRFSCGFGPISLLGGEYAGDRKMDDLKLLFRAYVTDALTSGSMDENKLAALSQLRNIFGLDKQEAESIMLDVTTKEYRKRLSQSVSTGDLEGAPSKAEFLQNLCDELHFDPQKAIEIHERIYRQKLQQVVSDGELSEEDVKALERLHVMLCIPRETVESIHTEICGGLFEKVVNDGIGAGLDGYDIDMRKAVRKAAAGLRLTREVFMSIASKEVRKIFKTYLQRARVAKSPTVSAQELKNMINFNTRVATLLVEDISGERPGAATLEELAMVNDTKTDEDLEWLSLGSLKKVESFKPAPTRKGQTEITLKDDLSQKERMDIYKRYLTFCQTENVTNGPLHAKSEKPSNYEYVLLNQLGGVLGLSSQEIVEIHRSVAEQSFRKKAEVILADGALTNGRVEQLNKLQEELGLPPRYTKKMINRVALKKLSATLETAVSQGKLSMKEIREHKKTGIDINNMISANLRESVFKKSVDDIFSSGTGDFDDEEVYEKIPRDLNINAEKSKRIVQEIAKSRLSNSLIQAVAQLRQRNRHGVVFSLNNLLTCDKVVPSQPLSWEMSNELDELFFIYQTSDPAPEKLSRLQYLLNINDSTAEALQYMEDRLVDVPAVEEFVF